MIYIKKRPVDIHFKGKLLTIDIDEYQIILRIEGRMIVVPISELKDLLNDMQESFGGELRSKINEHFDTTEGQEYTPMENRS